MSDHTLLDVTDEIRALIDARVAQTGRPREVYEQYLTAPPRPGQTWEGALAGRLLSLRAGPPTAQMVDVIRRMVTPADSAA